MSLSEAVLEIAEDMDKLAVNWEGRQSGDGTYDVCAERLRDISRQLRRVVKASEQIIPIAAEPLKLATFGSVPVADGRIMDWQTKQNELFRAEEIRRKQMEKHAETEEHFAGGLVECIGGAENGTCVPIDNKIPNGAKTLLSDQVYVFNNGKFHYSEEETIKYLASRKKS